MDIAEPEPTVRAGDAERTASSPARGCLVTLEGGDKAGKSTVIAELSRRIVALRPTPPELVVCREPGGTAFGERIRDAVLRPGEAPSPQAEMLAFAASRAQLVDEVIRPALGRGAVVLCDRYVDSTAAYQHYGRGLPMAAIERVHAAAVHPPLPDLTLLLDLDVDAAAERRVGPGDYIEEEAVAFRARVRSGYLDLAAQEPRRWVVIDASQPMDVVAAAAWAHVQARITAT